MKETSYLDLPDQTITFDIFDGLLDQIMSLISYCQYEYYSIILKSFVGGTLFFHNEYSVTDI